MTKEDFNRYRTTLTREELKEKVFLRLSSIDSSINRIEREFKKLYLLVQDLESF